MEILIGCHVLWKSHLMISVQQRCWLKIVYLWLAFHQMFKWYWVSVLNIKYNLDIQSVLKKNKQSYHPHSWRQKSLLDIYMSSRHHCYFCYMFLHFHKGLDHKNLEKDIGKRKIIDYHIYIIFDCNKEAILHLRVINV